MMLKKIAFLLTIIGGLNWGLVGLFGLDLVAVLFGSMTFAARVVYTLVGLCSVLTLCKAKTMCSK